jgi:hypothetical protein
MSIKLEKLEESFFDLLCDAPKEKVKAFIAELHAIDPMALRDVKRGSKFAAAIIDATEEFNEMIHSFDAKE